MIVLTYTKPLAEVDLLVEEHRTFLEQYYAAGNFLLSGSREPRNAGVILAKATTKPELEAIICNDPFYREHVAEYEIIEFLPSMVATHFAHLKAP